jgi:hypothetical protein
MLALEAAITYAFWAIKIGAHTYTYQKLAPLLYLWDDPKERTWGGLASHSPLMEAVKSLTIAERNRKKRQKEPRILDPCDTRPSDRRPKRQNDGSPKRRLRNN